MYATYILTNKLYSMSISAYILLRHNHKVKIN